MMPISQELLRVYETGDTIVVGFGEGDVPEYLDIAQMRDEIIELLQLHQASAIAFDLTGVMHVPSVMLGLLASLKKSGYPVHLYNPCRNVRSVLGVTGLDRLYQLHDLVA